MDELGQTPIISRAPPLETSTREQKKPVRGKDSETTQARDDRSQKGSAAQGQQDKVTLSREAQLIMALAGADRQVRHHEAAHSAAGGQYTGSPSYTYREGPDGKRYAVSGEVPIDVSEIPANPEATLQKAQVVRAAALAPVDPSAQDQKVAAAAMQMALRAQLEIQTTGAEEKAARAENENTEEPAEDTAGQPSNPPPSSAERAVSWYA